MKLKYLVAALGLVATAGSQAAIVNADPLGLSEAFLTVYDSNNSYTLDLGITYTALLAKLPGSTTTLATLGTSNWTTYLSGADTTAWQYAVLDEKNAGPTNTTSLLTTVTPDIVGHINNDDLNTNSGNVQAAEGQVNNYATAVSRTGTHVTQANGDSVNAVSTPGYFLTTSMDSFNGNNITNSVSVGTAVAFEKVTRSPLSPLDNPTETLLGTMQLAQVGSSYVLNYSTVAAVPEPTGYALALAGFGMLVFVARRRNDTK